MTFQEEEAVEASDTLKAAQEGKMQEKETLDEKLPGLFEPDTLLPVQYFEAMRRKHLLEGEKRLILSVLEDAIECYMKCIAATTTKGQHLFRDAEEWINLEDKRWVFSFDNVCEMLDINPEYMRAGLRRWKARKVEAMARRAVEEAAAAQAAQTAVEQAAPAAAPRAPAPESRPELQTVKRLAAKASAPIALAERRKNEPIRGARRHARLRKARG